MEDIAQEEGSIHCSPSGGNNSIFVSEMWSLISLVYMAVACLAQ